MYSLIILVLTIKGLYDYPAEVTTTTVQGFKNVAACQKAAAEIDKGFHANNEYLHVHTYCVPME